jgi:plasmid stability protein
MPNVTLALDEETYRKARIIAAENDTTVSAMVRDYLRELSAQTRSPEADAKALFAALDAGQGQFKAAERLSRAEANERGQ